MFAAAAALALPATAGAHGIGGVQDLPLPLWLFYYGSALVLVFSFAALSVLWREPRLERNADGRALRGRVQRLVLGGALRVACGAISVALFLVVLLAALVGDSSPAQNLAPTFVWVVFWLGLVPVTVLLGNVWSALNPWSASAAAVASVWSRLGRAWTPPAQYPEQLGRWPAAVLLFAFVALELAYPDPSSPRVLGVAILVYSYVTWTGMLLFGRTAWLEHGEAFTVYFGLLARLAPVTVRTRGDGRELVLRPPVVGLARREAVPGTVAFVAVMLGSVAFDGFSRSLPWRNFSIPLVFDLAPIGSALADVIASLLNLAGLLAAVVAVALAYLTAIRSAERVAKSGAPLADFFLPGLIPIALAYSVAHYFSLLVIRGQFALPLLSDPFGWGWDVLGTAGYVPDLQVFSTNTIWYVQAAALVVGHVIGLVVAHDRAVALAGSAKAASRSQYAMLALMILYTLGGLWLLSQ